MAYTDSVWAANSINCWSITGYFSKLTNGIFSWQSWTQKTIALSSTEAKYMALSDCSQQAMWIETLLTGLGSTLKAIPICGANQGSIFIGSNPVQEWCTKHIDICYHYVQQCMEEKQIELILRNPLTFLLKTLVYKSFLSLEHNSVLRKSETKLASLTMSGEFLLQECSTLHLPLTTSWCSHHLNA